MYPKNFPARVVARRVAALKRLQLYHGARMAEGDVGAGETDDQRAAWRAALDRLAVIVAGGSVSEARGRRSKKDRTSRGRVWR